jgi:O-methyltransferase
MPKATDEKAGTDAAELYIDLLKKSLSGTAHARPYDVFDPTTDGRRAVYRYLKRLLSLKGLELVRQGDLEKATEGLGRPLQAESMIGQKRMDNLDSCVRDVLRNGVPGDFIETGVWRGGAVILMRALLEVFGDTERTVWVADSFQGLPKPNATEYPADADDEHWKRPSLIAGLEEVKANFARHDLLDDRVQFLVGWFEDTLPKAPIERLAILRLDGDMYGSTMDALGALYHKVSPGGYVIIDDYGLEGCRHAVDDFRAERQISAPLDRVDWSGAWWQVA